MHITVQANRFPPVIHFGTMMVLLHQSILIIHHFYSKINSFRIIDTIIALVRAFLITLGQYISCVHRLIGSLLYLFNVILFDDSIKTPSSPSIVTKGKSIAKNSKSRFDRQISVFQIGSIFLLAQFSNKKSIRFSLKLAHQT